MQLFKLILNRNILLTQTDTVFIDDTLLIIIIIKAEIKSNHLSKAHALYKSS